MFVPRYIFINALNHRKYTKMKANNDFFESLLCMQALRRGLTIIVSIRHFLFHGIGTYYFQRSYYLTETFFMDFRRKKCLTCTIWF